MLTEPLNENEIQEFVYWRENSAPALVDSTANGLVDYSKFSQSGQVVDASGVLLPHLNNFFLQFKTGTKVSKKNTVNPKENIIQTNIDNNTNNTNNNTTTIPSTDPIANPNVGALGGASYTPYAITVADAGSGNRYYVDGVLQQQLYLQEGSTYRFDQSDSTNSGHPLRFSTTSNGTHNSGSEYTTGVKTYGTPGSPGSYTEIQVASGVATLYYYCSSHSNMGGTAYTPSTGTISLAITVSNPGSGNKYYIDSGGPAPTISLTENKTYRFDQSDSSNSGHPLRLSTTSDGSHGSGSEYTTGVTTNGTPGSAGAYTEITVASEAPTLYYYCSSHSGMGGQLNTPALVTVASVELSINETGLGGTGAVGDINGNTTLTISTGLGGTGAVGNHGESNDEVVQISLAEAGVAGTGGVGTETGDQLGGGQGGYGQGAW